MAAIVVAGRKGPLRLDSAVVSRTVSAWWRNHQRYSSIGKRQVSDQARARLVEELSQDPPFDGIYTPRKLAGCPKRRKQIIEYERRKRTPFLVLAEAVRTRGRNLQQGYDDEQDKLVYSDRTELDRAMEIQTWDNEKNSGIDYNTEVLASRLHDIPENGTLVVIGAGISGLSLAWFVAHARPDVKIRVMDKSSEAGGYMNTVAYNGDYFERGPRTLLPSHPGTIIATQMMQDIGMGQDLVGVPKRSPTNRKGLVLDGRLFQLPNSFKQGMSFLFMSKTGRGMIWGAIKDFLFARARPASVNDESVASFLSRRFNNGIVSRLVSAVMRGIYAGDVNKLSARSVARLNRLYLAERLQSSSVIGSVVTKSASDLDTYTNKAFPAMAQLLTKTTHVGNETLQQRYSMLAVKNGMQTFAVNLKDALESKFGGRVDIQLGTGVKQVKNAGDQCEVMLDRGNETVRADVCICTLGAGPAKEILTELPETERSVLDKFDYATLAVVNILIPDKSVLPDWFGCLIPQSENAINKEDIIGIIFDSRVRAAMEPVQEYLSIKKAELEEQAELDVMYGVGTPSSTTGKPSDKKQESVGLKLPQWDQVSKTLRDQFEDSSVYKAGTQPESPSTGQSKNNSSSNFTVMMGGDRWVGEDGTPAPRPSEQEIVDRCFTAIHKYFGEKIDPSTCKVNVTMQAQSIPQYHVGHCDRVQEIQDAVTRAYDSRVLLSGMTFGRGVGVGDCIVDSLSIASRFAPERREMSARFYLNNLMLLTQPGHYA